MNLKMKMKRKIKKMSNKTTISNNDSYSISKLLKYCAAALSIVSFLTTMHGVDGLIVKDSLKAGMISFAIQGIILLLGLYFLKVWELIGEFIDNKLAIVVLRSLVVILYVASLFFSSFFSFVFITNSAYDGVGLTDYNMEIDKFLVNSTNELEKINNENCDKLLLTIRTQAPEFNNLLQQNKDNASKEIESIKNAITKFDVETINEDDRFTVAGAKNEYRLANSYTTEEILNKVEEGCKEYEKTINNYIKNYEIYYNKYVKLYESLKSQVDSSNIEIERKNINELIDTIADTKNNLQNTKFNIEIHSVQSYFDGKRGTISNYYSNLIDALNSLISAYDNIENSKTVNNANNSDLKDFYESIYSSDIVDPDTIKNAESQLKELIKTYLDFIQDNKIEIDSEKSKKIESLSICISNLDSLKEGINLKKQIATFKSDKLKVGYIIQKSTMDNKKENADIENESSLSKKVTPKKWKEERQEHLVSFIELVKQISNSEKNSENDEEISKMLDTAYNLNRNHLEPISEMEIAINYYKSDKNKVAVISLVIAIFIDVASFLIGIILYFLKKKVDEKHE